MGAKIGTRVATGLFRLVARNESASGLVSELKGLKRGAAAATVLSLILPLAGLGAWQRFGYKSEWLTIGSSSLAIVAANSAVAKRKKLSPLQEKLKIERELDFKREKQRMVNERFPETVKPPVVNGIGGQVQLALAAQNITVMVDRVVDAPAFHRVRLNLLDGITIHDVRRVEAKITSGLGCEIPVSVVEATGCDCAIEIAKPDKERRFVTVEKYLIDGFFPSGTPITLPAGINADNELIKVKALDPNYIHPLIGGGTGSGKSQLLLGWIRWLLQWQPADVQIVLVDPKHVTFGQLEWLNRVSSIAETMGISVREAEELFPEMAEADRFSERMKPWLPFGVVKDPGEAIKTYSRMVAEMMRRYGQFRKWGVQNLEEYNDLMRRMGKPTLPVWFVITDEYYMQVSGKEFKKLTEEELAKLGAMARAAGISMVISTQRPSYDVLSLTIRDNCMWRYCLRVKGSNPAQIILGLQDDPEQASVTQGLAGKGDAICEFDGRYERVQAAGYGNSMPGVPTLFPEPLPEPGDDGVTAAVAVKGKKSGTAVAEKPVHGEVKQQPSEDGKEKVREIYVKYRQHREANGSFDSFVKDVLKRKSGYDKEWKARFFQTIAEHLFDWIGELAEPDEWGNQLMPEQIVSRVFGTGLVPKKGTEENYEHYLAFVQRVLSVVNGEVTSDE